MKLNFNLSEHFSMAEALHTNVKDGIISNINHFQKNQTVLLPKLQQLAAILERIRATVCVPIYVTSFLRSFYTNAMVGGVSNSLHLSGRAVDFSLHNIQNNNYSNLKF